MNLRRIFFLLGAAILVAAGLVAAVAANDTVATAPVYVPDTSHQNEALPDGVFAWNSLMLQTNAPSDASQVHFVFDFTNIFRQQEKVWVTNKTAIAYAAPRNQLVAPRERSISPKTKSIYVTNVVAITNSATPEPVSIIAVHPSCGCTTAKLPPLPWTIPPGGTGEIPVTVNVEGKIGSFIKSLHVTTSRGYKDLLLRIDVLPPVVRSMTDAERQQAIAAAKIDRMAVFRGDCATCHVKNGEGKYGQTLYQADCAICHEAKNRASFVPDLHSLKVPTNQDFWRTWIMHGKPGSFMPAFSQGDGGPLSDLQIASLAAYLNQTIPSNVPPAPQ